MRYTLGSLFSGIGGLEMGLEMTGRFETVWQSEVDPFCQSILERNFVKAKQLGDINEINEHEIEAVDVICGGFPCQDVSTAGRGAGLDGERTGLFFRAMQIVSEIKPSCVILENVTGLLTKGFERVLGAFQEIGYDVEWNCVSAQSVGYPHKRERIFIIAYPAGVRLPGPWTLGKPVNSEKNLYREAGRLVDAVQRSALPFLCTEHDGVDRDTSVAIMKALGNAVVPDAAKVAGERALEVLDFRSK
jgi:DNA (cytosine-5)-methyltransferase 1